MSTIGERVRLAMAMAEVDQADLADGVGCTQSAISQILVGTTQRSRFLPDIAQYLGVSLRWIKGETDDPQEGRVQLPSPTVMAEQLDLVAIQSIDLAYGLGASFTDLPIETQIMHFPRAWIESITSTPAAMLTWVKTRGDSMVPTIASGDMAIIDRSQRVIREPDAIWAYTVGDIGGIKRLKVKGDRIIIMSDNKIVPDDEEPIDEVRIVGRVAFIGKLI